MEIIKEIGFNRRTIVVQYRHSYFDLYHCVLAWHNDYLIGLHITSSLELGLSLLRSDFPNANFIKQEMNHHAISLIKDLNESRLAMPGCILLGGTDFQNKVWESIAQIKYGETKSYQDIAKMLGKVDADRAIGSAVSKNPIALLIPCHRIIGKNGDLKNFKWSVDLKKLLLRREGYKFQDDLF